MKADRFAKPLLRDAATMLLLLLLLILFVSNEFMDHTIPVVSAEPLHGGTLTSSIRGSGTVVSAGTTEIRSPARRIVNSVRIREGQKLKKGELLISFGAEPDAEIEEEFQKLDALLEEYDSYSNQSPLLQDFSELKLDIEVEVKSYLGDVIGTTPRSVTLDELKIIRDAAQISNSPLFVLYDNLYTSTKRNIDGTRMMEENGITWVNASLERVSEKITEQQERIRSLLGEGSEGSLFAPEDCTVMSVNCKAGDMVKNNDVLCVLETKSGVRTVSFTVKPEQAEHLHIGDEATVGNGLIDSGIRARLSSIKTVDDGKRLTFELEGNIPTSAELTLYIGQESTEFDYVVPNTAIHTDAYGSYVLTVTAIENRKGEAYMANRAAVEVLAADESFSAISGRVYSGDWIIIRSDSPIGDGDRVGLAETEE